MLRMKNDTFTELEHKSIDLIEVEKYEAMQCANVRGALACVNCIGEKVITEVYPGDSENTTVLELFDPEKNTCKKIGELPFSAEYGTYSCICGDRYFSMITAEETDGKLYGRVSVFDVETDNFVSTEPYKILNIVQYITSYNSEKLLFLYYEAETQDRVIMSLDLPTNETTEIYRETNMNEEQTSPVALAVHEDNIVLVLQYIKDNVYHTRFEWISPEGELLKTEEPDLYKFFDSADYLITDLEINGEYYYLKAAVEDREEYFIFKRDGKNFHVVLPAICRLNNFAGDSFSDEENLLFYQNEPTLGDLINIDLKNNSLETYQFSLESLSDDVIKFVKCNSDNSLMIFSNGDSGYPECRIIPDYTAIDAVPPNSSLYISPRQLLEQYVSLGDLTQEEIEELREHTRQQEDRMKQNDFRWKFAYN